MQLFYPINSCTIPADARVIGSMALLSLPKAQHSESGAPSSASRHGRTI